MDIFSGLSSPKLKKPVLLFKKNYVEWMVPILHAINFKDWNYLCYGALVHPRVVLSADQPFDE